MADTEEIQVSFPCDLSGEDPSRNTTEVQDEKDKGDTQNNFMSRLKSKCQVILIVVLLGLFCAVTGVLFIQMNKSKSVTAELQYMAEKVFTMLNTTKQLQIENSQLEQLLNSTVQNFTRLRSDYDQLKLLMNATQYNFTLSSAEKTRLSKLLKNTMQEKAQLHVGSQELNMLLMSTLENCSLVEEENRKLNQHLNKSLRMISLTMAENKHVNQLLIKEQQTSKQLQTENKKQRSILFSEKLSFIWRLCNRSTLQCTRCLPGWVEHASRCFFLSPVAEKWEVARRNCLEMGGDLAVVLSPEDQAFLTNLTYQFGQENPQVNFHSAWIGLQDMVKEGTHFWVNGKRISSALRYWKDMEPNNAIASWDHDRAGQDCVAIVRPRHVGVGKWLNSWDDIVCGGKRHYLCETMVLSWS